MKTVIDFNEHTIVHNGRTLVYQLQLHEVVFIVRSDFKAPGNKIIKYTLDTTNDVQYGAFVGIISSKHIVNKFHLQSVLLQVLHNLQVAVIDYATCLEG